MHQFLIKICAIEIWVSKEATIGPWTPDAPKLLQTKNRYKTIIKVYDARTLRTNVRATTFRINRSPTKNYFMTRQCAKYNASEAHLRILLRFCYWF